MSDRLVFIDPDGSSLTKLEYLAKRGANPDRILSAENPTDRVRVHGDVAIADGVSRFRVERAGKQYAFSFRWISTYVKEGGRRRTIAAQLTPVNPQWIDVFVTRQ